MTTTPSRDRHFHVPAVEMLLEDPVRCIFLPTLTLDGIAVTDAGQHHLVLTLAGIARFYIGPDDTTVARRAQILTAALSRHLKADHADLIGQWIQWSWDSLLDELVDRITHTLK